MAMSERVPGSDAATSGRTRSTVVRDFARSELFDRTFQEGMDLATAVPLDAQALLSAAQQGAETNQAEGWVRNLNTTALQSQLSSYQARQSL